MAFKAKVSQGHRSRTTDEAIAEATKEAMKSLIINMPESTHRAFKAKASQRGETMKEVVLAAIDKYISQ